MILDDRKRKILHAIIDDYINTAEPIGSRTIARKYELSLSSATIRNEMADLEDLGYLAQPHTSSGRIPSDKGYRFYVDRLMKKCELSLEEIENIKNAMDVRINELSQLIKQASRVMSDITKYTSMAVTPEMKGSKIKAIQVSPIEIGKALVVVVTNTDVVKNTIVKIADNISPYELITASNIVNDKLKGHTIEEINLPVIREIQKSLGNLNSVLMQILDGVAECINKIDNSEVYLNGTMNILNYPEFKDVLKARDFINLLDTKGVLIDLLNSKSQIINNCDINIKIGEENALNGIKECSLITTTYSVGDAVIGYIGIIGPTRMDYPRVISLINCMKTKMNEELLKLIGEVLD